MANTRDRIILLDGPRNVVVRWTGVLDSGNESWVPALALNELASSDGSMGTLRGLRVDELQFSAAAPLSAQLEWNGNSPQLIALLSRGDNLNFKKSGGLQPDQTRSGYDGSINLRTVRFAPGAVMGYTVEASFVKLYVR